VDRTLARRLIFGSAAIGSLGTFAMHLVLPALPDIREHFASTLSTTQLLVSLAMLSIAAGNIMVAPLSDRYGRRPIIVFGLGLFLFGSVCGALAPSIGWLIAARIVQAFGSGAAMAVARATLMDFFGPERAATGIAYTATAILVVPMLAPTLGGIAVEWQGWRAVFVLCAVLGIAVLAFTLLRIRETHARAPDVSTRPDSLASYRLLLAAPGFRAYAFFGATMFAAVSTFIANAPHVVIDVMGLSPSSYGLYFILTASGSFSGFFTAARISRRVGAYPMMRFGLLLSLAGGILMVALALAGVWRPLALFVPAALVGFANAIAAPNSTSSAIAVRPDIAGAASGLVGFVQLVVTALVVQAVALFANRTPYPLVGAILALNLLAAWFLSRVRTPHPNPLPAAPREGE
jgi:DHA1 family bicyclomycin/chloramphenicol resistance-like MFS transporter